MYENGFSEKIEADRIEVAYNNALSQRNTLRRTITNSASVLKFQMGMPLEESIEITEELAEHEDLLKEKMQKAADFNYADRIEYDILNTQRELAELDQRRIQSLYLPDLYFNANYGANTFGAELGEIGGDIFTFSSIGLSTSIPIFDGFRKKYQIAQRKIEVKQIEVARQQLENRINLEQEQNLNNLDNALETLGAQERNMELAQEIYRISKIKYQEGVGSVVELVDAEGAYKEAETNYYAALFDAILAKVDYEKATGLLFREN
jgi:outer membrane protein